MIAAAWAALGSRRAHQDHTDLPDYARPKLETWPSVVGLHLVKVFSWGPEGF